MVSYEDKWIRLFGVQDVSQHKKGFTIYKIVSMLYPRDCPDAITKVTVWKRFNDFKRLHHDMETKCKSIKLRNKLPSIPNTSYFKRFNEEVIEERRQFILNLLNSIGLLPELYTSDVFVKFFKSSYMPSELLASNINNIRSDLNLPAETEYHVFSNSDEENAISECDSLSISNSLPIQIADALPDPLSSDSNPSAKFSDSGDSVTNSNTNLSDCECNSYDGQKFLASRTYSWAGFYTSANYILEAAQYINQAIQYETEKKFQDAFNEYNTGINILERHVKDEKQIDLKEKIRQKIEKYQLRKEKIYSLYLSPEIKDMKQYVSCNENEDSYISNMPFSDLYKYKVIKVIGSGMVVLYTENQQLFFVKVIHKNSNFCDEKLVLPKNVPYHVKLKNYFNCENALFLILEYVGTPRLQDYIKQNSMTSTSLFTNFTSNNSSVHNESDVESDYSYSDLINEYTLKNKKTNSNKAPEVETSSKSKITEELNFLFPKNIEKSPNSFREKDNNITIKSQELVSSLNTAPEAEENEVLLNRRKSSYWNICDPFEDIPPAHVVPIDTVLKWSAQLLLALEKLHNLGVICGNLQMKHLLIDENENIILTYKCRFTEDQYFTFPIDKNKALAPEFYGFQKITSAVDWWSYGIILYELLVGMDFKLVHPEDFTHYTVLRIPKYVPLEGRSLLKQLLVFDLKERLGCGVNGTDDIKSHPFFSSISWTSLNTEA